MLPDDPVIRFVHAPAPPMELPPEPVAAKTVFVLVNVEIPFELPTANAVPLVAISAETEPPVELFTKLTFPIIVDPFANE
jgi:hypothetical protein